MKIFIIWIIGAMFMFGYVGDKFKDKYEWQYVAIACFIAWPVAAGEELYKITHQEQEISNGRTRYIQYSSIH